MPPVQRVRPQVGDVIEFRTPRGLAYAQYTHRHVEPPKYGCLLRVLPGIYAERPTDFAFIVKRPHRFWVFFPLGAACARRIVTVVAREMIPAEVRAFPTFRSANREEGPWFLWNGSQTWRVESLSEAERQLPINPGVWNDTLLIERIANNWEPPSVVPGHPVH